MKSFNLLTILLLSIMITSCGREEEVVNQAIADSVESAISAIAGVADEQAGETVTSSEPTPIENLLNNLTIIPSAYAAVCSGRAFNQACSSGVRSISYSNCTIGSSSHTLSGNVSLTYSDSANCDIDTNGETVTRTYDFTRTTNWGAKIRTFSSSKTDYEGNTYGGGGRLTKTASGFDLTVLGKHRTRTTAGGRAALDISMRTTSDISLDQIARNNRTINGGTFVIAHNLAKYKVSLSPSNLTYTSSCCYPTGGTINVTYSGIISGSGSVTFTSCGSATLSRDAESYDITFYSCE